MYWGFSLVNGFVGISKVANHLLIVFPATLFCVAFADETALTRFLNWLFMNKDNWFLAFVFCSDLKKSIKTNLRVL